MSKNTNKTIEQEKIIKIKKYLRSDEFKKPNRVYYKENDDFCFDDSFGNHFVDNNESWEITNKLIIKKPSEISLIENETIENFDIINPEEFDIVLEDISQKIKIDKKNEINILNNINLVVPKGQFLVLYGQSGSGKTSLLGVMSALSKGTSGKVWIKGNETSKLSERKLTNLRKKYTGYVFQQYGLLGDISVLDNVLLSTKRNKKEYIIELLKYIGLENEIHQKVKNLSGGQQQRVSICRALAKDPDILFADEPTGAIDSKTAKDIISLFLDINKKQGKTLIMVTHNQELMKIGDRLIEIRDGRIHSDVLINKNEK